MELKGRDGDQRAGVLVVSKGPHHTWPGAPRRQRHGDADGRGRSGRPHLFNNPERGATPLPRCAQPRLLLFRSNPPTLRGGVVKG